MIACTSADASTSRDIATGQTVDRNEDDVRTLSYWLDIYICIHVVPITITGVCIASFLICFYEKMQESQGLS